MLVSTKGRYALRVMIDLAKGNANERTPLRKIADRQGISEKYLENILSILVRNSLLSGMRGKGGGYCLTKSPDQYTVGQILRLTEGSLCPVSCLEGEKNGCEKASDCPTLHMWSQLDSLITGYLDSVTIADIAQSPHTADCVM